MPRHANSCWALSRSVVDHPEYEIWMQCRLVRAGHFCGAQAGRCVRNLSMATLASARLSSRGFSVLLSFSCSFCLRIPVLHAGRFVTMNDNVRSAPEAYNSDLYVPYGESGVPAFVEKDRPTDTCCVLACRFHQGDDGSLQAQRGCEPALVRCALSQVSCVALCCRCTGDPITYKASFYSSQLLHLSCCVVVVLSHRCR